MGGRSEERDAAVWRMYYLLCIYYATGGSYDVGSVTACMPLIIKEFDIQDFTLYGLVGSMGYYGMIVALPLTGWLFQQVGDSAIRSKTLLLTFWALLAFAVLGPMCCAPGFTFLLIGKFLVGVGQAACDVFVPVWIEQYAPKEKRATWLAFRNIWIVTGILFSYAFSSTMALILEWLSWRCCFAVQGFSTIMIGIVMWTSTSSELYMVSSNPDEENNGIISYITDMLSPGTSTNGSPLLSRQEREEIRNSGFIAQTRALLRNSNWLGATICLMTVFTVAQGLQFWSPEYLRIVFLQDDPNRETTILGVNVTLAVLGSGVGIALGGYVIDQIGGYDGAEGKIKCFSVLLACAAISTISGGWAQALSGLGEFKKAIFLQFLVLFFGSFTVGPLQGIAINAISDRSLRTAANAIAQIALQIGGSLGPLIPGVMISHACAAFDKVGVPTNGFPVSVECVQFAVGPLLYGGFVSSCILIWSIQRQKSIIAANVARSGAFF